MKYVVGAISFFDNILKLEVVEANSIGEAVLSHSSFQIDTWMFDDCESLEEMKERAFDTDMMIDVIQIEE